MTISLCMIVKNEEKILRRCLDSLKGIYDEAIIVDTGSTDATKAIAAEYTDKVYDFEWVYDFSKARNYAMSLATCDYIYMADADEVLDEENRQKFLRLKAALDGEVEVVQMYYVNQLSNGSVYNYDREPRAKLYKRERKFTFIDPIHEVIRELPVVYDSDIDIMHMQQESHSGRDLETFRRAIVRDGKLSNRLIDMYARELVIDGKDEDFSMAYDFFAEIVESGEYPEDALRAAYIVLAECALLAGDEKELIKYSLKDIASGGSAEMCCILGVYFEKKADYNESFMWYYNARYETEPLLNIRSSKQIPVQGLIRVLDATGQSEAASKYREELKKFESGETL